MKHSLSIFAAALAFSGAAYAQPRNFEDFNVGAIVGTVDGTNDGLAYSVGGRAHGSILDWLLEGKRHKFRIGDVIGIHASFGAPPISFGWDLGAQAAYGTETASVGLKYVFRADGFFKSNAKNRGSYSHMGGLDGRLGPIYAEAMVGRSQDPAAFSLSAILRYHYSDENYLGVDGYRFSYMDFRGETEDPYTASLVYLNWGYTFE